MKTRSKMKTLAAPVVGLLFFGGVSTLAAQPVSCSLYSLHSRTLPACSAQFSNQFLTRLIANLSTGSVIMSFAPLVALTPSVLVPPLQDVSPMQNLERAKAARLASIRNYGRMSLDYVISMNNLGVAFRHMGDYVNAIKCYRECIQLRRKIEGHRNANLALNYSNLAAALDEAGRLEESVAASLTALSILKEQQGDHQLNRARCYHNLGSTYDSMGKYDMALDSYRKAAKIRRKKLGDRSFLLGCTLTNIGVAYANKGNLESAESTLQAAWDILHNQGRNNINTVSTACCMDLARVLMNRGKLKQAEKMALVSAAWTEELYGPYNVNCYPSRLLQARIFSRQHKFPEAEKVLFSTLKITGLQSVDSNVLHLELISLYILWNRLDKAESYANRRLQMMSLLIGMPTPQSYGQLYFALAQIRALKKDYKKSLEYCKKAIVVFRGQKKQNALAKEKNALALGTCLLSCGLLAEHIEDLNLSEMVWKEVEGLKKAGALGSMDVAQEKKRLKTVFGL